MLRNPGYSKNGAGAGSTTGGAVPLSKRTAVPSPTHSNTSGGYTNNSSISNLNNNGSYGGNSPLVSSPENNGGGVPAPDLARKRQVRKDDAIRKKLDQELGRKTNTPRTRSTRTHGSTRPVQGTVGALRPSPALTLLDTALVIDAARVMAAKRADAVLVIDRDSTLVGIMTDKDLAFRVIAEGLDIRTTLISHVMTRNPYCVTTDTNATEALNKMVTGGFRHLPCLNSDGDVVGLLDITKCLYEALEKLEKANQSSKKLVDALEGMQSEWAQSANPELQNYVELMREKMAAPDLNTVLNESHGAAEIQTKTTVREATKMMKLFHTTASLIMEDGRIAGIFTTKDIVVRVMATGLEPDRTSVIRVMTPRPDTVLSTMTILDALKMMHSNHYLHLPVVYPHGQMAGLVDVLQVSLAMLKQMGTIQGGGAGGETQLNEGPSEGPVWNKFWETSFSRDDTGSEVSASEVRSTMMAPSEMYYGGGGGGSIVGSVRAGSVLHGHGSAPGHYGQPGNLQYSRSADEMAATVTEFTFKFKEPGSDQTHRFVSSSKSFRELHDKVVEKLGLDEIEAKDVTLSYCDEENDQVLILQDSDVADAVQMAFRNQWALIRLTVSTPSLAVTEVVAAPVASLASVAPVAATSSAAPAPAVDENAEQEKRSPAEKSRSKRKEQVEGQLPITLVLPGIGPVTVDPMVAIGGLGIGVGVGLAFAFAMIRR